MIATDEASDVPVRLLTRLMGDVRHNSLSVDRIAEAGGRVTLQPRQTLHPVWFGLIGLGVGALGLLVLPRLDVPAVRATSAAALAVTALVLVVVQAVHWARAARGPWMVVEREAGLIRVPRAEAVLQLPGATLQLITGRRTSETQILATELNVIGRDTLGQWTRCGVAGVACEDDAAFRAMARMLARRSGLPLRVDAEEAEAAPDGFEVIVGRLGRTA